MSTDSEAKRARPEPNIYNETNSKLYSHFRAVGMVTNQIPATIHYMGGVPYITTSVGRSFQILDIESLNIVFVSPELGSDIIALQGKGDNTIVVTLDGLFSFDRARLQNSIPMMESGNFVAMDITNTSIHILTHSRLSIYAIPSLKLERSISLTASPNKTTCFVHPMTYLNKVLIGFEDGHAEIWNISSGKLVYTLSSFGSPISTLAPAPVLDIIAIGLQDGTVWIMDILKDERLFSMKHQAAITGLSFRTDDPGNSQLAASLANGTLALWDLNDRSLHTTWEAHSDAIRSVAFINNQPVIVTTGDDNSLREWVVEGTEVRLLKSRSGHSKTPRRIRFYGDEGDAILSAGRDKAFRIISLIKDSQSMEISQGSIDSIARRAQLRPEDIKFDPIIDFDSFSTKDLKWDNVVTAHEKSHVARTWRANHRKIGSHELHTVDNSHVKAVAMSACGNFAILGTASGCVDIFNVQSGQHRKHFVGCSSSIIGLGIDAANQYIICIHSDGNLRCIEMVSGRTQFTLTMSASIIAFAFHSDAELLSIALDNNEIRVIDVQSRTVGRLFIGHTDTITDLHFSRDARWLVSASLDKTICTWDLATGIKIDILTLSAAPVSIALSPIMDFLAVVMERDVSVHLWVNLSMYKPVTFERIRNYSTLSLEATESKDILSDEFIQLSLEPQSKWTNLFHLDTIKARNKPILPPRVVEKAPFFLDALLSVNQQGKGGDDFTRKTQEIGDLPKYPANDSILRNMHDGEGVALEPLFLKLIAMSPSQIDLEIRSLVANSSDELGPIIRLIDAAVHHINSHRNYELAITCLSVILRVHADVFLRFPIKDLAEALKRAQFAVRSSWSQLGSHFHDALCLCSFSRGA